MGRNYTEGTRPAAFITAIDGMNAMTTKDLLQPSQYAMGVNVTSRSGKVNPRPPFVNANISNAKFTGGQFQGAGVYRLNDTHRIICACGGEVVGIDVDGFGVTDYSGQATCGAFATTEDLVYMVQAEKYFVIQDGVNDGIIIESEIARRPTRAAVNPTSGTYELPVGTHMAYGHGRLFTVVTQVWDSTTSAWVAAPGRFFMASNILLPHDQSTILNFNDITYPNSGGAFALPNELGFIKAMRFLRSDQTGTGTGALIVFGRNGASGFDVGQPRSVWEQNMSRVLFTEAGTESHRSVVEVNNDMIFRGLDGLRTVGYTMMDLMSQQAGLTNKPMSKEVDPIFALDRGNDLKYVSCAYADNRVLATAVGDTDVAFGQYFKALVSYDALVFMSGGQTARPIFDGIWTGMQFLQVISAYKDGKQTFYVIARNPSTGLNELWYTDESAWLDNNTKQITSRLYTRAYSFESGASTTKKRLAYAEVSLADIRGEIEFTIYYRPFGYELWNSFETLTACAEYDASSGVKPQRLELIRVKPSDKPCDPVRKQELRTAGDFEFCLELTGQARIDKVLFYTDRDENKIELACQLDSTCQRLDPNDDGIELDDYDYSVYGS